MRRFLIVLIFLIGLFLIAIKPAAAKELDCGGRYATLVNPVRGRNFWIDKSLQPIEEQYGLTKDLEFPATWLVQYDALVDEALVDTLKNFDDKQEFGVFLEVSPSLAFSAQVPYPYLSAWDDPGALFLSGYSQSQRRKLIDRLFSTFKKEFGAFPKSVGAWWIDSYSLGYLRDKYRVETAMIVADQKTTDDYGVWGQWWGVAYYPAKMNILVPGKDKTTSEDVVITQWAQRDLSLAVGEGPTYSNYSLQANDYPERGKDITYFLSLAGRYLDCRLPVGQITVGLETGIESVKFLREYSNQLQALAKTENLKEVTLSEFGKAFRNIYSQNPERLALRDETSEWILTTSGRTNERLKERTTYTNVSFADYFVADKANFLDRNVTSLESLNPRQTSYLYLVLVGLVLLLISFKGKILNVYLSSLAFSLLAWAPVFRTQERFGWRILYGPDVPGVATTQIILLSITFCLFWLINRYVKKEKSILLYPSLAFGLDALVGVLRLTVIQGTYYLGVSLGFGKFFAAGINLNRGLSLGVVKLPPELADSLLRFDFTKIYANHIFYYLIYPLGHVLLGILIFAGLKKVSRRVKKIFLVLAFLLSASFAYALYSSDPAGVLPLR